LLPQEVVAELKRLTEEIRLGSGALHSAEVALAEAEHVLDSVEQKSFLAATGTVAERQAESRLTSAEERLSRDLRRAEVNRIKMKVKGLESALMATQTMARIMEMESKL